MKHHPTRLKLNHLVPNILFLFQYVKPYTDLYHVMTELLLMSLHILMIKVDNHFHSRYLMVDQHVTLDKLLRFVIK